ncbi:MAG: glycosyltransferase family protein [Tepidisphaeraceae bacterium]
MGADASPVSSTDADLRAALESRLRARLWSDAADVGDRIVEHNLTSRLQHRLAKNLAGFERHRPEVFGVLAGTSGASVYTIVASKTGHATVSMRRANGSPLVLSPNNDPVASVNGVFAQLRDNHARGEPFALCGLGDGYLVQGLAQNPPKLILGMEQTVYVIEPDPQLVWSCMMIHDYAGPAGPIEQRRFQWVIGPDWRERLDTLLAAGDYFLPIPVLTIRLGIHAQAIDTAIRETTVKIAADDTRMKREIDAHYAAVSRDDLAALFGPNPPRRPRALLLTTKFSTVLQYSTRDSAEGLERAGWETRVLIERHNHERTTRVAMRKAIAEFKPDFVFQLDHLRHEHSDLFPANLPFACWIQDHLPNLMNGRAGASITPRDFVLTNCAYRYHAQYGYPLRQCVFLSKATRLPHAPASWKRDGHDLAFVSNCSRTPMEIAAQTVAGIPDKETAAVIGGACERMIGSYATGRTLESLDDLRHCIIDAERGLGLSLKSDDVRRKWCDVLWHPLNDTLYRQQALRWAITAAKKLNLRLALYGNGWAKNPEFAAFDRGYITYGQDLEELTRRTRVNLHIVPYGALHQRLLDGLAAGGFYLVRDHPRNRVPFELMDFVDRFAPAAATSDEALSMVPDDRRDPMRRLLAEYHKINELCDAVSQLRDLRKDGFLLQLPCLDDVCFSDAATFEARLRWALEHLDRADAVAAEQRAFVERHLTYAANMRRVTYEIGRLIRSEA